MKDNFLLKKSLLDVIKELSDEDTGRLFKGILNYVNKGDSELTDYLKVIFIPIKNDIDKNEEAYQKKCEINKLNGSKGGAPKGNKNAKQPKTTDRLPKQPKTSENNMNNHNHIHNHNSNIINHNQLIKNIIDYLNNKTNSKYKYNTRNTQEKINARLNEGYNLDDFIAVIDKKYDEWVGTEFEIYLCPETLFGTKFEKYLNQKVNKSNKPTTKGERQREILEGIYNGTIKIN